MIVNGHTEERVDRDDHLCADTLVLRSDESLVALAKSGGHLAFTELCDRHRERAYRFAYRITRNREDAEDAVQESLLKSLVHLQTFDGRSTFSTWFMRITMNSAIMTLRNKRVRTYLSLEGRVFAFAASILRMDHAPMLTWVIDR